MFGLQVQGQHLTFESPSAFSIYLKRLVNPARKADDGWKTVKCNGRFLEQYKLELARRRFGKPDDDSAGNNASICRSVSSPMICMSSMLMTIVLSGKWSLPVLAL